MADTVVGPLVCPQGHGPGVPGSRFCTLCGSGLVAEAQTTPPACGHGSAACSERQAAVQGLRRERSGAERRGDCVPGVRDGCGR